MNIKMAAEKTGLTKKAIKYYESEGLINPIKNSENNYRDYSEQDIIKLNLIGALRAVDIPISEIKSVIEGKRTMLGIMQETLEAMNKEISNLERSKSIITNIIEKNLDDYYIAGIYIKKLRETLELSIDEKKEFISKTLLRIFPGGYGKRFVAQYEPFLNITIDSEEKRNAWLNLIEVLDDFDELSDTNEFISQINNYNSFYSEDISNEEKEKLSRGINKFSSLNDLTTQEVAEKSIERMLITKESDKDEFRKMAPLVKDMSNSQLGNIQRRFTEYLSILSEDYKKYLDNSFKFVLEFQNRFMKQTGLDLNTWIDRNILEKEDK